MSGALSTPLAWPLRQQPAGAHVLRKIFARCFVGGEARTHLGRLIFSDQRHVFSRKFDRACLSRFDLPEDQTLAKTIATAAAMRAFFVEVKILFLSK